MSNSHPIRFDNVQMPWYIAHTMIWRLFLMFTLTPVIELALLMQVGHVLGVIPTITLVITTGIAGALLARSQGLMALRRMQEAMSHASFPGDEIFDGVLILMGGLLLLTPGFVTDFLGFAALLPGIRSLLKSGIKREIHRRIARRPAHPPTAHVDCDVS